MSYFLMVFDRPKGEILLRKSFGDPSEALKARILQERKYRSNPDIEVVILGADSEESLERTHTRYFRTLKDLTAALPTS